MSDKMSETKETHDVKADMKKAYDDIASTYLTWTESSHKERLLRLTPLIKELEPKEQSQTFNVLELGCGAGVPCTQLLASKSHLKVTGNDISSAQIALARERLPQTVDLIEGDMMNLNFEPEQFDAVLAMYSVIHLPREEQSEILRRIYQWLKPGGRFLANFSVAEFEGSANESWLGGKEGAVFWSGWGRDKTKDIIEKIGFKLEIDEITESIEEDEEGNGRNVPFYWVQARKAT